MVNRLPLNAMQAFEVAANSGSFAAAAAELGVSAAAVSQHVRLLEDRLNKQLFFRRANGVELTDAGRELFLRVSFAFGELTDAVAMLKTSATRPRAVISVISSVGTLWLLPRLAKLDDQSGIQIIEENQDPVDFATGGIDLRITYGAAAYSHHDVEILFHDKMVPVATPALAKTLTDGVNSITDNLMIHTAWGPTYANPQAWAQWFDSLGSARRPDIGKGLTVSRMDMGASAARQGLGVALLPETLAAGDIASGMLVAVGSVAALMPQPYVMISRPATRRRSGVEQIWQYLLKRTE